MSELLRRARIEAARLRETLDLFDVGVCIIERAGEELVLAHSSFAVRELLGVRVTSFAELLDAVGPQASALMSCITAPEGGRLAAVIEPTASKVRLSAAVHVLEADLLDSVVVMFQPTR